MPVPGPTTPSPLPVPPDSLASKVWGGPQQTGCAVQRREQTEARRRGQRQSRYLIKVAPNHHPGAGVGSRVMGVGGVQKHRPGAGPRPRGVRVRLLSQPLPGVRQRSTEDRPSLRVGVGVVHRVLGDREPGYVVRGGGPVSLKQRLRVCWARGVCIEHRVGPHVAPRDPLRKGTATDREEKKSRESTDRHC